MSALVLTWLGVVVQLALAGVCCALAVSSRRHAQRAADARDRALVAALPRQPCTAVSADGEHAELTCDLGAGHLGDHRDFIYDLSWPNDFVWLPSGTIPRPGG